MHCNEGKIYLYLSYKESNFFVVLFKLSMCYLFTNNSMMICYLKFLLMFCIKIFIVSKMLR